MTIPIPHDVRQLLDAPNYVHLPTVRANGSPRNWVVWVGPDRVCFVIVVENAARPTRAFVQDPPLGGALDRGRT
jgi:hypothetical protein